MWLCSIYTICFLFPNLSFGSNKNIAVGNWLVTYTKIKSNRNVGRMKEWIDGKKRRIFYFLKKYFKNQL